MLEHKWVELRDEYYSRADPNGLIKKMERDGWWVVAVSSYVKSDPHHVIVFARNKEAKCPTQTDL